MHARPLSDDFYEIERMLAREKLATHCHLKSGGLYRFLHRGQNEKTLEQVVIYEAAYDGRIWVRVAVEFDDGRYAPLTKD